MDWTSRLMNFAECRSAVTIQNLGSFDLKEGQLAE